ncbi:MAG: hypothetical protein V1929_05220 [bacterium]
MFSLHPQISAWLATSLVDRDEQHRRRVLAAFEDHHHVDFYDRSLLEETRNARLVNLLTHARERVPWFREHLKRARINPAGVMAALRDLPPMRRVDIQTDISRYVDEACGTVIDDHTGGSTGTPMTFKVDTMTQIARETSLMWADQMAGWSYGERIAMLWGSHRDVDNATLRLRLMLRWWLDNRRWFNAFDMGEDQMESFHRGLSRFKPHILVAYAGSMFSFARFLKANGMKPRYPIRAIVSSAEVMTPDMRSTVEQVFGKPVYDRYGNRECGAIAAECGHHAGLHVNESDCLIEIDSPDPFHIPGQILVTYLRNYAMPLIRYETGDVAMFKSRDACACGRSTLRLSHVLGRQSDLIRTAEGSFIHGEFFTHVLYGSDAVREFQFVQESLNAYTLRLVADRARTAPMEQDWRGQILGVVGRRCKLSIEYVDSIPTLPSGKRKFTLSLLDATASESRL